MDRFNLFLNHLKTIDSNISIKYKDTSIFMKILGIILFFNTKFSTSFTTTIGKTIYFPSKQFVESDENRAVQILAHEFKHVLDNNKYGFLFSVLYLFPQILSLFSFFAFYNLWFLLFLVFLLPLPAYWRAKFEADAYGITLFFGFLNLKKSNVNDDEIYSILANYVNILDKKIFKGSSYYFMWPFGISKKFFQKVNLMISGDILSTDEAYVHVKEAFDKVYH